MKKIALLFIIIATIGCNKTGVTIVEFEDDKSNAIRGHYKHYLNNDIDGLKKLWADDDKIALFLGSVEQTPLSELIGLIGAQHKAFNNIHHLGPPQIYGFCLDHVDFTRALFDNFCFTQIFRLLFLMDISIV